MYRLTGKSDPTTGNLTILGIFRPVKKSYLTGKSDFTGKSDLNGKSSLTEKSDLTVKSNLTVKCDLTRIRGVAIIYI